MNLTFKKEPKRAGGLATNYTNTIIKGDGLQVGEITAPTWRTPDNLWRIRLCVKDGSVDNFAGWKWEQLRITKATEIECRKWLEKHWKRLQGKYMIHQLRAWEDG